MQFISFLFHLCFQQGASLSKLSPPDGLRVLMAESNIKGQVHHSSQVRARRGGQGKVFCSASLLYSDGQRGLTYQVGETTGEGKYGVSGQGSS